MLRVFGSAGLTRGAEVEVPALKAFVAISTHLAVAGVAPDAFVNVPCQGHEMRTDKNSINFNFLNSFEFRLLEASK